MSNILEKSEDSNITLGQPRAGSFEPKRVSRAKTFRHKAYKFYKDNIVYRLFWGRSNLYRKFIHISFFGLTTLIVLTGFSNQFFAQSEKQKVITTSNLTIGNVDALEQGGSIQTILLAESTRGFKVIDYTVVEGDTFDTISAKFGVTIDRIKLSNLNVIGYYDDNPKVGVTLKIPEINGILIEVKSGDTFDSIMSRLTKGERLDVIEINNLKGPEFTMATGDLILVPDGLVNPPAPPVPVAIIGSAPPPAPIPSPGEAVFAGVSFIDPLSHPDCGGYAYSRGFSSWHQGVDLAKWNGCPIRASAAGTVTFAGWSSGGQGFMVRIDHGSGVQTEYFHGNGSIWVSAGQSVFQGQDIMQMGCTGFCTGTHLHLTMMYNWVLIDPAPYIPYWRSY